MAPYRKERQHLYTFVKKNQSYKAELMGTSPYELESMIQLYNHGFPNGPHLRSEEHSELTEHGDTIGIRSDEGKLVALRVVVYERQHTKRYESLMRNYHAYQNHIIIEESRRGKGLIEIITHITINLALKRGKQVLASTVNVKNIAMLRALTRQGYKITFCAPDHYGDGTIWYLLERAISADEVLLESDNSNLDPYFQLYIDGMLTPYLSSGTEKYYLIETTNSDQAQDLLARGYKGVSTIIRNIDNYLIFER